MIVCTIQLGGESIFMYRAGNHSFIQAINKYSPVTTMQNAKPWGFRHDKTPFLPYRLVEMQI